MLAQLPDVILMNVFRHLSYDDRLKMEQVCGRFRDLMNEVWSGKQTLVFPYDIWRVNPKYPVSSCLDDFGNEMSVLIDHCSNLKELRFENFRRLQIVMQSSCMSHFEKYEIQGRISDIFIGGLYVTDVDTIREMGRVFPNLQQLTIAHPYPLVHRVRPDTLNTLRARIGNLEPQLWPLIDDNARVTEDIRFYLELFKHLKVLKMKHAIFEIREHN